MPAESAMSAGSWFGGVIVGVYCPHPDRRGSIDLECGIEFPPRIVAGFGPGPTPGAD